MGIITIVIFALLGTLGVLCALLSAFICGIIAYVKKIGVARFSGAGALYGVFIFPWIYLVVRMFNRFPALPVLAIVYLLAYALWLGFIAGVVANVSWLWEYRVGSGKYLDPERGIEFTPLIVMSIFSVCVIAICLFTMALSLRGLYRLHKEDKEQPTRTQMPPWRYLLPYLYAYLWFFVGGMTMALITATVATSNGIDIQGF